MDTKSDVSVEKSVDWSYDLGGGVLQPKSAWNRIFHRASFFLGQVYVFPTVDFQKKLTSQFGPNFFVCCRFHFIFGDCSGGVCSVLWHVFYLLEVFCARCRSIWVYATPKKCHSICMCQKMNSRVKNLQTRLFDDVSGTR